jgi:hypothetical protein
MPTATGTATPTASGTATLTPTITRTATRTETPSPTSTVTATHTATSTPTPLPILVGDPTIESRVDVSPGGTAKAFQYTALASGSLTRLSVYLDASSTAGAVVVGIYTSNGSNSPGSLLTQGLIYPPVKGAWNTATVQSASVTAGTEYWIAVLAMRTTGTVAFRDVASGGRSQLSAQTDLYSLPPIWSSGASSSNAPMSAHALP